jgi:hypothetical protein
MEPLRDIPVETIVDGVTVTGIIATLYPNDITVVITSPVSGWESGLHVPHFAMHPASWLATWEGKRAVAITTRGIAGARWVLEAIYAHATGRPSGWGVSRVEP